MVCCTTKNPDDESLFPKKSTLIVKGIHGAFPFNDTTNWIQEAPEGQPIGLKVPIKTTEQTDDAGTVKVKANWTDYFAMSLDTCTGCELAFLSKSGYPAKKDFSQISSIAVPVFGSKMLSGDKSNLPAASEVYKYSDTHNERVVGNAVITMRTTNFMTVPIRISPNNIAFVNDWIWAAENFTSAQAAQYEMFSDKFHGGKASGYTSACAEKGTFSGAEAPAPGGQKLTSIVDRKWTPNSEGNVEGGGGNRAEDMYNADRPFEVAYKFVKTSVCVDYSSYKIEKKEDAPITIDAKRPTSPVCAVKRVGECAVVNPGATCTWSACSYEQSSLFAAMAAALV